MRINRCNSEHIEQVTIHYILHNETQSHFVMPLYHTCYSLHLLCNIVYGMQRLSTTLECLKVQHSYISYGMRHDVCSSPSMHLAAVKANDHPAIIKILATLGCGFDCASRSEVEKVLSFAVNPNSIVYANPHKQPDHIL